MKPEWSFSGVSPAAASASSMFASDTHSAPYDPRMDTTATRRLSPVAEDSTGLTAMLYATTS